MSSLPGFISMYSELVAAPSVSCLDPSWDTSNKAVIDKLAGWFESLGFQVQVNELDAQQGKFNMLASYCPAGNSDGGLLLAGHTDTVPWDEGRWTRDPFKLTEADGKLYGLGSADMKGFFAFILEALRDKDLSTLKKPLRILATADEETTMAGARELNKFPDLKPDYAVIGEPTNMAPVIMHKGHLTECVRVTGRSGHSSNPAAGLNAIEVMHEVISELLATKQEMAANYQQAAFEVPYPTLNLGHIHGGDAANRICACCELHLDMRPLPGMNIDDLYSMLNSRLHDLQQRYPDAIAVHSMHAPIPGYACPADSAIVKLAEELSGEKAQPANYCTEAPFVQDLGCETIIMGPGSIRQAHQPDEYITLAEINPSQQQLGRLIERVCGPLA
ncbi:acetylornithine deacetylase [Aliidiomarina soli]|uniref:Acetylornithine deacetylase n=1 Tax=Aliidiomarina soli TaxID=1928574 RepID=A0A432WHU5_9GAMM|nr:acetylornithine deacetylase [Aliidiomarina soli]RUO33396.1 acetylornithine deacetylase [Aliidiomarina soli]